MDPQIAQMDADEARKRNGSADGADQDNICLDGDWIWWEV
jgi:hypothetical protein